MEAMQSGNVLALSLEGGRVCFFIKQKLKCNDKEIERSKLTRKDGEVLPS